MDIYLYMAPKMNSSGHRNTAVDIYSLGCLYIELFGVKRVWQGISDGIQIMQKVCGSFNFAPEMPATGHLDTPLWRDMWSMLLTGTIQTCQNTASCCIIRTLSIIER